MQRAEMKQFAKQTGYRLGALNVKLTYTYGARQPVDGSSWVDGGISIRG